MRLEKWNNIKLAPAIMAFLAISSDVVRAEGSLDRYILQNALLHTIEQTVSKQLINRATQGVLVTSSRKGTSHIKFLLSSLAKSTGSAFCSLAVSFYNQNMNYRVDEKNIFTKLGRRASSAQLIIKLDNAIPVSQKHLDEAGASAHFMDLRCFDGAKRTTLLRRIMTSRINGTSYHYLQTKRSE